jgi:hypothetical protein
MLNLEPLAALAANRMVLPRDTRACKTSENTITKALAVLAEQGVYAFGLFLATRKNDESDAANLIHEQIRQLLRDTDLYRGTEPDKPSYYRGITAQIGQEPPAAALRRLLLTKQLMETTLTYARYHAKALGAGAAP